MRINESHLINASTTDALNAAERWLRKEAPDLSPHRGISPGGLHYVGLDQFIDGVEITTRFIVEEATNGTVLSFHLRMQGRGFMGKVRNLSMLPAIRLVRRASQEQFAQIVDELENPTS